MDYSDSCADPSSEDDGFRYTDPISTSKVIRVEDLSSEDSEVYDEVKLKSSEIKDSRSRSNSTPENNIEEEEENSPTILRPFLPRAAKDLTNAIKLTYATPQFQNQRSIGHRIRSDSGQSSRTYSRSRSPINSRKCCNIIGTYHEPSECPILLEKHSQPNEEGVPILPISVINGQVHWEIEKILDSKLNEDGEVTELLVKWAYFTTPTWHSIDAIADSPQTLTEYFFEEGVKKTLETICNVSRYEKLCGISNDFVWNKTM
uniref:Chromo domain-containing protein n=1 Tax=Meloidogyne javanica TaxID=6303 RepID=A0A915LJ51_MELJA